MNAAPYSNRAERRRFATWSRLRFKRADKVAAMSRALAVMALRVLTDSDVGPFLAPGRLSRNDARRRLVAEVVRRYGKAEAHMIGAKLLSAKEAAAMSA